MATTLETQVSSQSDKEALVVQIISDAYPALDCGPGTPIYEMVVRPIAVLWSKQAEGVNDLINSNTLTDVEYKSDSVVDRLLTKFFMTRRTGSYVSGVVRIYFSAKQDVYISAGTTFEASGNRYYSAISDTYTASAALPGNETDGYFVDVAVQSVGKGNFYNASANDAVTLTGTMSTYVRRAYFLVDATDGGTIEDNTDFVARTKDELALRGMFAYKTSKALIRDNFDVQEVVPIGLRDDEMIRDLVAVRGVGTVHIGGKGDIYIRSNTLNTRTGYYAPLGFPYTFNGKSVTSEPDALMAAWNAANLTTSDISTRGSLSEDIPLLTSATPMTTLQSDITDIAEFVNNDDNDLLHTDNLVKEMWPLVVAIEVTTPDNIADGLSATIKENVASYINSLTSTEYPQAVNVLHVIKNAGTDIVRINIKMTCYYLTEDLRMESIALNKVRQPATSLLVPQEDDSLKFVINDRSQLSLKTCCWYTNEDLIQVEVG